jgi:hypothetical protein
VAIDTLAVTSAGTATLIAWSVHAGDESGNAASRGCQVRVDDARAAGR